MSAPPSSTDPADRRGSRQAYPCGSRWSASTRGDQARGGARAVRRCNWLGTVVRRQPILLTVAIALATGVSHGATLRVPSEYPTIQSAIQAAAPEDTILVAPGLYDENLDTQGKWLNLIGEAGAEATIVDAGNRARALTFDGGGVVEGFTFRRGRDLYCGAGLWVGAHSGTMIRNNIIEDNVAGYPDFGVGGGIYLETALQSGVTVQSNQIRNNYAGDEGGGIYDNLAQTNELRENVISGNGCHVCGGGVRLGGSVFMGNLVIGNWSDHFGAGVCAGGIEIRNNTIVRNLGHGIDIREGFPLVANNVVANNGVGIQCSSSYGTPSLQCNDSWNNKGGDYLIHASCDTTGGRNFSADPLFCNEPQGDFRISEQSPCSPSQNPACGLIGAFPVGCGITATEPSTWGRLKASYRLEGR